MYQIHCIYRSTHHNRTICSTILNQPRPWLLAWLCPDVPEKAPLQESGSWSSAEQTCKQWSMHHVQNWFSKLLKTQHWWSSHTSVSIFGGVSFLKVHKQTLVQALYSPFRPSSNITYMFGAEEVFTSWATFYKLISTKSTAAAVHQENQGKRESQQQTLLLFSIFVITILPW